MGTAEPLGYTGLTQRIRRWLQSKRLKDWYPKVRSASGSPVPMACPRVPVALRTKSLLPSKPRRERKTRLSKHDANSPVKQEVGQANAGFNPFVSENPSFSASAGFHSFKMEYPSPSASAGFNPFNLDRSLSTSASNSFQIQHPPLSTSAGSRPSEIECPSYSSWQTSPSADFNGSANTGPYVAQQNGCQRMTSSALRDPRVQLVNQTYATRPTNSMYYNAAYPRYATPQSTQIYSSPQIPTASTTISDSVFHQPSANTNTHDILFLDQDFRTTPPRTAAEVTFIESMLEYTRAEYEFWLGVKPPPPSLFSSYIEQYGEMQAHLEQRWPYPCTQPVKLRSLGPVSGVF